MVLYMDRDCNMNNSVLPIAPCSHEVYGDEKPWDRGLVDGGANVDWE